MQKQKRTMSKKETLGVVLGAAKIRDELVPIFGDIPTALIPINGKPVIFFILEHFKSNGINNVYVSVGYQQGKVIKLLDAYSNTENFNVHPVVVDYYKKPGSSLFEVLKTIPDEKKNKSTLYVHLADTVPHDDISLPFDKNFILVSDDYFQSEHWCVVDVDADGEDIKAIFDKQKGKEEKFAVVGVYHFNDLEIFNDISKEDFEISYLLHLLIDKSIPIKAIEVDEWFDLGHLKKYYQVKSRFFSTRFFNSLKTDDFMNTIVKKSDRDEILKNEILWYLNIPKDIRIYTPRIIDCNTEDGKEIYAELEFYGYPSLSELWLYTELSQSVWQTVIDRVFAIVNKFRDYQQNVSLDDYIDMYVRKTNLRVKQARKLSTRWSLLFDERTLLINGKKLKGWPYLQSRLNDSAASLYKEKDNCFLHGDLCFSNILFDLNYGVVKIIDPRGSWGSQSYYGDIKYDIAKLRHSISGLYDHIVHDHFSVTLAPSIETKTKSSTIDVSFPLWNETHASIAKYFDSKVGEIWDINQIKFIEGLLFISMIPLHANDEKRQIAMFARGIELLNEFTKRPA